MTSWSEVAASEPEFAARVRRLFDAHKHKTMATLRKDGSPRISGIEVELGDDEVWLGMMPDSLKAADLRRDPRLAVHSASEAASDDDPSGWPGDAKLAGQAVEVVDPRHPARPTGRFRVELIELVVTRVGTPADHLVIESWHPGRGLQRRTRR